jgi:cytoskeletal protein CcmA (bactofilin family)
MKMIGKTNKQEEQEMEGKMNTLIGKDSVITGTIDVKGPLRIDGRIEGKVICGDTVTVGNDGHLKAEINCKNATIAGRVEGNIKATEKLELQAKAEITGDLQTKWLVIEQGAVFSGACNMKETAQMAGPGNTYAGAAEKVRERLEKEEKTAK